MIWSSDRAGYRSHGSWGAEDDIYIMFFDGEAYDKFRLTKEEQALLDEEKEDKDKDEKDKDSKKERINHVHHCIDAIVIACIGLDEYNKLGAYYHDCLLYTSRCV